MASIQLKSRRYELSEVINEIAKLEAQELESFIQEINYLLARKKVPNPTKKELQLITKLYKSLDNNTQKRYDDLTKKLNDESISEKEHEELLTLVETTEAHNINWLQTITELAQLRKTSVEKVIQQLGVTPLRLNA